MFKELYKNNLDYNGTQEERRQALLEKQKEVRRNLQDEHRSLEEKLRRPLATEVENGTKCKIHKNSNWQQKQQEKLWKTFRETYDVELALQQSEWFREVPGSICDWLLVPCPRGQRSLVVAYNRQTKVYNKLGRCVCVFRSMLPGDGVDIGSLSILDCIYVREQNVFYVLDVLAFGGTQNLLYCEAEFRFFWLRSKWSELEYLEHRSANNQKPFNLVKQYDFENKPSIAEALQKYPLWPNNKPQLDGFLFYHRFSNYTCGTTPLVGWLFAFMVPDILDMEVNELYEKPEDYVDALSYMDAFDERLKVKWQRSRERETHREQRLSIGADALDSQPTELSILTTKNCDNKINSMRLTDPTHLDTNPEYQMWDDTKSDSGDENSLEKVLETQRELEMLPDIGGEEMNIYA